MGDKQRRDYGSGSISQRKDGTWTARMIIGTNEAGNPRIKAFYGKSEREVKKKMKEFEKELHKNDGTVVQKNTVETYMRNWLYSVKSNELKPKSFDRLEQTIVYQVIPHIVHGNSFQILISVQVTIFQPLLHSHIPGKHIPRLGIQLWFRC